MYKLFVFKFNESDKDILLSKMSFLPLEERDKVNRFKYDKDKALSLSAKLMLFTFASSFKDEKYERVNVFDSPDIFSEEKIIDLKTSYLENGKGMIDSLSDTYFNISHSGDYSVLALSDTLIGVDIQLIKSINKSIAEKYFTLSDNLYIKNVGKMNDKKHVEKFDEKHDKKHVEKSDEKHDENYDNKFDERMIRVWCSKEAYAKLTGKGFSQRFETFRADFNKNVILEEGSENVLANVFEEHIDTGYICLVCTAVRGE